MAMFRLTANAFFKMADRLKDAVYLLRVFRGYKQGITLLSLADVLHVSTRTVFRRLASLEDSGIPVYKREIDGESYYYLKRAENKDFADIFEYFEPVALQPHRSVIEAATEFDVKHELIFTVVNNNTKEITSFTDAESAASYFPELKKSIFYIGGRRSNKQEHENFIIYKSSLVRAKIKRSKYGKANKINPPSGMDN